MRSGQKGGVENVHTGETPYNLALESFGEDTLKALQLRRIVPDEVNLTPKLIQSGSRYGQFAYVSYATEFNLYKDIPPRYYSIHFLYNIIKHTYEPKMIKEL